ncbi:T9SS type A sorting domain-containing protein [Flavobacterium wongokense]|uniref:T9SS type A sorting domain-containing protein n=1 Tax=Flavobacterium wongokense TaxID=2910674 RepID=UPI001F424F21|nr:T9SS type A sorting domain-containing protein [Flavobacterium sp. WG47]MCF6131945.1 T9SS type A sorting domain-containing protein [Flavobacterium sp. WG47]
MKTKLLLFFSLCLAINANSQCPGVPPPPPGLNYIYALDMENDGFATFDLQQYIDDWDRPLMEYNFNVSSSGYNFIPKNTNNEPIALMYTNVIQNESIYMDHQYSGSGPMFEPQPPCYWPIDVWMNYGLRLIPVPFDGDFDNDGILNQDEDTNFNRNLMDDDDDHDGIINLKDTVNNLGLQDHTNISLSVYPNPVTNGIATFESNAVITSVTIYDLSGKQLSETKTASNTLRVDSLAAGIYFLKFESENGSVYKKIVIN